MAAKSIADVTDKIPDNHDSATNQLQQRTINNSTVASAHLGLISDGGVEISESSNSEHPINHNPGNECEHDNCRRVKITKTFNSNKDCRNNGSSQNLSNSNRDYSLIKKRTADLVKFITMEMLKHPTKRKDKVEETLLRCVNVMLKKHVYFFRGLKELTNSIREEKYTYFKTIADEIFEGERTIVNWGRVIALYCLAAHMTIVCKQSESEEAAIELSQCIGCYASDVITPFIASEGGWEKLCSEYPPHDELDNNVWNALMWTAVSLFSIATLLFFTSSR